MTDLTKLAEKFEGVEWLKKIARLDPCEEALIWLKDQPSLKEAYTNCARGDWLLWLARRLEIDRKLIVLAACECAEQSLKYIPKGEDRPRQAIETARAWTRGEATLEQVRATATAADAAAADAAAAYAAAYAAYAADAYAYAYAAAYAAGYADYAAYADADADADAYAAYTDHAAYGVAYAAYAREGSLKLSADITRKHIPCKLFEVALGLP